MFDNLKISKKMFLLSGIILGLLLIVLIVGMYGMDKSVKSGRRVTESEALISKLSQLEIDHLNWAGQVAVFLSDDNVNNLSVQVDHKLCGFGKWYYGEGRRQAELMIPEIAADLRALEEPHKLLHDTAKKIKAAYRPADLELPEFLIEKEVDHLSWAFKVQMAILAKQQGVDVQFDHKQCSLGKYIYSNEGRKAAAENPELAKVFNDLEEPHKMLHQHGARINELLQSGRFDAATTYFSQQAVPTLLQVRNLVGAAVEVAKEAVKGKQAAENIYLTESREHLQVVQKRLTSIRKKAEAYAAEEASANVRTVKIQNSTVVGIGILALLLGIGIAVIISRSLAGPMRSAVKMLGQLEKGHLSERLHLQRKDEIGQMADSMDNFADSLQTEVVDSLQKLAAGDLTFEVTPRDDQDVLRGSLKQLGNDLNEIMAQIQVAGREITLASDQVADSSQTLSQGATEQAASLEEISASLHQTSSQTTLNADNATQANGLSRETKAAADKGSAQMQSMVASMSEINEAGQNISKIIKTIDEIAFQTNLLALNAAVEAARAGQHGKGFAVVAEEVRNLAARSAKAAAETAELIQGSVEKTVQGTTIANQTSTALQEIVVGIGKVTDLVAEIAAASKEQALGVAEINQGISQIDIVTQQNTATAEESASAAEEMSGQASQLSHMLQRFKLKPGQNTSAVHYTATTVPEQVSGEGWGNHSDSGKKQPKVEQQIVLDDAEFGRF
ncbi:methyl-accepting chemotaxis protein [uncultured Desulfuromusa sp.]|uniref:methyl-accepting chemotaxis protein n=1 Tax=uncultured Desulfuromusa sp. TaxID=219183 RepID=UPI002AA9024F|nr:methyl-accepting chemotaxis protein [uncultured Desulfuromusa sp.]